MGNGVSDENDPNDYRNWARIKKEDDLKIELSKLRDKVEAAKKGHFVIVSFNRIPKVVDLNYVKTTFEKEGTIGWEQIQGMMNELGRYRNPDAGVEW